MHCLNPDRVVIHCGVRGPAPARWPTFMRSLAGASPGTASRIAPIYAHALRARRQSAARRECWRSATGWSPTCSARRGRASTPSSSANGIHAGEPVPPDFAARHGSATGARSRRRLPRPAARRARASSLLAPPFSAWPALSSARWSNSRLVAGQPLAHRAQLRLQPVELALRDQRLDPVPSGPAVARRHAEHLPAPAGDGRGRPAGRDRRAGQRSPSAPARAGAARPAPAPPASRSARPVRNASSDESTLWIAAVDQRHRDIDHRESPAGPWPSHRARPARPPGYIAWGSRRRVILSSKRKPSPRGKGRDVDDHVAELAVPARLLLVAAVLGHRAADRFAIADRRRAMRHLDPVAPLEPRQRGRSDARH